jgi:hypothetical protein
MEGVTFYPVHEKSMDSLDILKFLEKRPFFPFANIAYRILLTFFLLLLHSGKELF